MLLALGLTTLGTAPDLALNSSSGLLSKSGLIIGCLLAVVLVQRRSVFGPMVQPPLITLVIPLLAMFLGKTSGGGGVSSLALGLINPLINSFPMMALTAGLCLALGLVRMFWLERAGIAGGDPDDPEATVAPSKRPARQPAAKREPAKREPRKREPAKQEPVGDHSRGRPEDRQGRRPRPESSGRPGGRPAGEQGGARPRNQSGGQPGGQGGKPRGGPKPERGGQAPGGRGGNPPGRGAPGRGQPPREGGRPAPGRGQPDPQRRPRRPRGDGF